jgi:hypothetical protein
MSHFLQVKFDRCKCGATREIVVSGFASKRRRTETIKEIIGWDCKGCGEQKPIELFI